MAKGRFIRGRWLVMLAFGAVVAGGTGFAGAGNPPAPDTTALAQVNGIALRRAQLETFVRVLRRQGIIPNRAPLAPEFLLDRLIDDEVLAQEAVRQGLDRDPGTQRELEAVRRNVLALRMANRLRAERAWTRADLERVYAKAGPRIWPVEYTLQEIIVTTQAAAAAVEVALANATAFGDVARRYSRAASAPGGGLRRAVFASSFPHAVASALEGLAPGERTLEPIQANGRWYWLSLVSVREPERPPVARVADQLRRFASDQEVARRIEALRKRAVIRRLRSPSR